LKNGTLQPKLHGKALTGVGGSRANHSSRILKIISIISSYDLNY